ncbi:MarR family transcriptional regulator [Staphylococcus lentus]|uniref:transcriptional regulator, SarA/Rot family n=1 Tax=Mammaliicoccus lentus TaxID=42858 RepID=UPI00188468BE|nr:MarR family transcriptional regulator [Mammaliicoccus lentus]MBF0841051.1 MarR family transcriptional regulator [Mammaliicoccus lentus]
MREIVYYELFKKDILKTIYREKKLKRMDILTLFYLSEIDEEEVYVRKLRDLMFNPPSSEITNSLKTLEHFGLLKKVRDPFDERALILKNIQLNKIHEILSYCSKVIQLHVDTIDLVEKKKLI